MCKYLCFIYLLQQIHLPHLFIKSHNRILKTMAGSHGCTVYIQSMIYVWWAVRRGGALTF